MLKLTVNYGKHNAQTRPDGIFCQELIASRCFTKDKIWQSQVRFFLEKPLPWTTLFEKSIIK